MTIIALAAFCAITPALAQSDAYPFGDPNLDLKSEEEESVAAYLNEAYYKFK